ncbi:hypothetical protein GCM10010254_50760 [Streptomyces chromofuscus]|uniref:Transposase domain-containing protein n=1 Tax=Streptomyces chromofuscus TaxID=42881 RepID=A0A7M2TH37_STRCW|nr:transposase domain-containing protein [Streptomyces chromofuscus]GGT24216.1 hypothetical protein GCM10010254_50760 [Streptomyces chromofuscus]
MPFEMVDDVLAGCGTTEQRLRKLPARVVVYLLLAAALFEECGYPAVWRKLTGALGALPLPTVTATGLWHARCRLGVRPLRALFDLLRGPASAVRTAGARWAGLLVVAADGTYLDVADDPAVRARLGEGANQYTAASGYPQVLLIALVACGTRAVIDAVFGPRKPGEPVLGRRLTRSMRQGMVVLLDRGFRLGLRDVLAGPRLRWSPSPCLRPVGIGVRVLRLCGVPAGEAVLRCDTARSLSRSSSSPATLRPHFRPFGGARPDSRRTDGLWPQGGNPRSGPGRSFGVYLPNGTHRSRGLASTALVTAGRRVADEHVAFGGIGDQVVQAERRWGAVLAGPAGEQVEPSTPQRDHVAHLVQQHGLGHTVTWCSTTTSPVASSCMARTDVLPTPPTISRAPGRGRGWGGEVNTPYFLDEGSVGALESSMPDGWQTVR